MRPRASCSRKPFIRCGGRQGLRLTPPGGPNGSAGDYALLAAGARGEMGNGLDAAARDSSKMFAMCEPLHIFPGSAGLNVAHTKTV